MRLQVFNMHLQEGVFMNNETSPSQPSHELHQTVKIYDKDSTEGIQNGRRFKCLKSCNVCCWGIISLIAIASGSVIGAVVTPLAVENGNNENYGLMTAFVIGDLGAFSLIIAGGWKIARICCELRAANQMYPSL